MPPIGGQFISSSGGSLGFRPFQGVLPLVGSQPSTVNQTILDVERWELERTSFIDDTTHTGSGGNQGQDVTCLGFRCAAEMMWDLYRPPNFLGATGGLFASGLLWDVGYQFWAYLGAGASYPVCLGPFYYFSPSVKTHTGTTIIDAAGKKMVRARIDVIGNSPLFSLGGTINEQAQYDAYIAHSYSRNWVW